MAAPTHTDPRPLIAAVAKVLHGNGQETEETLGTVRRLGRHYGLETTLDINWGELIVRHGPDQRTPASVVEVAPVSIGMNRVIAATGLVENVLANRLPIEEAEPRLGEAASAPPASDLLFSCASAVAALALAVSFGITHPWAALLIFIGGGLGGYVRRRLGRHGADAFVQAFCAALLAGVIGALGVRLGLSSELRLIALCPCMVIVPGPHILNGMLDLLGGRIPLGIARLVFATIVLTAICAGVLLGMALCGADVPPSPAGRSPHVWLIMTSGAAAAVCYGVFYAMPPRLLVWPALMAVVIDMGRWAAMTLLDQGPVVGAAVAGLIAGLLALPLSRWRHVPFASIGFSSIVSLIPGALVFRMAGGLWALQTASPPRIAPLVDASAVDGSTAVLIVLALSIGIVAPKYLYDALGRGAREAQG